MYVCVAIIALVLTNFIGRLEARIDKALVAARKRRDDPVHLGGILGGGSSRTHAGATELWGAGNGGSHGQPASKVQQREEGDAIALAESARAHLGPMARCLMSRRGTPRMRDQHIDIACRFLFLVRSCRDLTHATGTPRIRARATACMRALFSR